MALQTTQVITRPGITPTYSAVAASDTFVPGADTFLHVKNGGGSSITVNVPPTAPPVIAGVALQQNVATAVPAGQERMIGPFPAAYFGDPTTGLVTVNYTGITTVTAAVLSLVNP